MISYGFILTSLIIILMPGTGVIYTVSTGLTGSKKDCIAAAVGCTAGIIPHLAAQMIILSIVFMGLTLIIFILYGLLANYFKTIICSSTKITRRLQLFGVVFIGFATKLAFCDD